ncbi:MAG: hypothetical protein DRQ13_00955 [Ignavibacteriae bacterium]|nr:MAG: hypothetical protein DRQ13_00955 [Ignavibacteriota bacterium]
MPEQQKFLFDNKTISSNISSVLLNEQANNEQIKLENSQMNIDELKSLSVLSAGEESDARDERMFPPVKDDYILCTANNKEDDENNEKEDENPFDKEPTDKDIVEEDLPIVDPEEDIFDNDEEVPYN